MDFLFYPFLAQNNITTFHRSAELLKNRASPDLLKSFYEAYNQLGFGYIINHGIDPALIEKVFDASKKDNSKVNPDQTNNWCDDTDIRRLFHELP